LDSTPGSKRVRVGMAGIDEDPLAEIPRLAAGRLKRGSKDDI
jgi:hypothetical protein